VANRASNSVAVLGNSRHRSSGIVCVMAHLLVGAHITLNCAVIKGIGMPLMAISPAENSWLKTHDQCRKKQCETKPQNLANHESSEMHRVVLVSGPSLGAANHH